MIINIFGKRGAGKTHMIKGLIPLCAKPAIIVDVLGNYDDPKYYQSSSASDTIERLKYYVETKDDQFSVIVLKTPNPSTDTDYVSAALWHAAGGTLVLDELDSISIPESPCFDQLIRYGRNHNVDMITGCRRPAEISKNITAAGNKMYCFGTTEPRDVDYFQCTILGDKSPELMKCPKYSGIFVDYDREIIGKFRVDSGGNVFENNIESL